MIRTAPCQWTFVLCALGFVTAAAAQTNTQASQAVAPTSNATTETPTKVEPDYTLSYNVGGVTDYRYRGISQTRLNPALQGGVDFGTKRVSTSAPGPAASNGSAMRAAMPAWKWTSTVATRARSATSAMTSACCATSTRATI